jgi:serine/threonine protein kinase
VSGGGTVGAWLRGWLESGLLPGPCVAILGGCLCLRISLAFKAEQKAAVGCVPHLRGPTKRRISINVHASFLLVSGSRSKLSKDREFEGLGREGKHDVRRLTPKNAMGPALAVQDEPAADAELAADSHAPAASPLSQSIDSESPTCPLISPRLSQRTPAPLPVIDGYDILGILGRGGMGVVYQARQTKLNRLVALKMVLAGKHAHPEHLARFCNEADAVARLQHPHIVQIYDINEHDGLPYFCLEYVAGGSLDKKLNGIPLQPRRAAHLVEILARAMHVAHAQGIVHRDLKPSNVLLARSDALHGVKLDNTADDSGYYEPKISDFGLAKRLNEEQKQTQTGAIMGTPGYMAPEQADSKKNQVGPATDVYALGAILYELLTGRPPFLAETPFDTLLEILEHEPAPPRLINARVERDLETICLKCLEKDPASRYTTALALAEDLRRYCQGEPISARGYNILDRLGRTLERSRYDIEFHSYASMLHFFAALVLVVEMVVHLLVNTGQWVFLLPMTRVCQVCLMGLVFWRYRSVRPWPGTASEQQLWSIWIGYVATCALIGLTGRLRNGLAIELELTLYPSMAAVTGLIFFIMGSICWGRCYAFGVAFFVLALVMAWRLDLAPLAFGGLWAAALVTIGRHLKRLGARASHRMQAKRATG